jgi:hypothetical protein
VPVVDADPEDGIAGVVEVTVKYLLDRRFGRGLAWPGGG